MNNLKNMLIQKSKSNKVLISNFSYLSALQIFNMLIPLATYPYLIRVLGKESYGLIAYAQAIIGYLGILVSFGFDVSAVKEISIHRNDSKKISEITSSVIVLKGILFLLSSLVLVVIVNVVPQAENHQLLFYITMFMLINTVLYPNWYFQGIEKMKYITYINLISRVISVPMLFIFITSTADYLLLPIINGVGAIVAGLISLYIIFGMHKVSFVFPSYQRMKFYLNDSLPMFISNVSIKLYVSSNKVIIGTFLSMSEVAYYDLAEKILSLLRTPMGIFSQTIFPKINKEKNLFFVKKVFWYTTIANTAIFVLTLLFSKYIVLLLGGEDMLRAIWVVNILAFIIPIVSMSNVLGFQMLIPWGYNKPFSKVIVLSGLVYLAIISLIWLTIGLNVYSVSASTVGTEIFVTSYMYYFCKKYKLW